MSLENEQHNERRAVTEGTEGSRLNLNALTRDNGQSSFDHIGHANTPVSGYSLPELTLTDKPTAGGSKPELEFDHNKPTEKEKFNDEKKKPADKFDEKEEGKDRYFKKEKALEIIRMKKEKAAAGGKENDYFEK